MKRLVIYGVIFLIAAVAIGVAYHQMSTPYRSRDWTVRHPAPPPPTSVSQPAATRQAFVPSQVTSGPVLPSTPLDLAVARAKLDVDETEIDSLISQMGSDDFQKREQALKKLKSIGPEAVPALQRHGNDIDPEIASRLDAIIASYEWMKQGAIVVKTEYGQAARLGIKPGDVIVKVDDTPVADPDSVSTISFNQSRTLWIWRTGKIVPIKVAPGPVGVRLAQWSLAKGGNDQARGLSIFERRGPDTVEAYRRLRQARQAGMDDRWTIGLLGCLAAQQLDQTYAMECYRIFRGDDSGCDLSHQDLERLFQRLPFSSSHSAFLLERFRSEPWSPLLYHELEDWFCRNGRNYPMLRQVLATPWTGNIPSLDLRRWDAESRLKMDLMERRWADARRDYQNDPDYFHPSDNRHTCALMAAISSNHPDQAVDVAVRLIQKCGQDPDLLTSLGGNVWYALEAAGAAGDAASVQRLAAALRAINPQARAAFVTDSLHLFALPLNTSGAQYTLPVYAELARLPNATSLAHSYLRLLASAPKTTREEFEKAWANRVADPERARNDDFTALSAYLRFGDYEKARAIWEQYVNASNPRNLPPDMRTPITNTLNFLATNAQRLATDWAPLRGMIQVIDGVDPNTRWIVRWDGAVWFLDAPGKIHEYPGLPLAPVPLFPNYPYLRIEGKNVLVSVIPGFVVPRNGWTPQNPPYVFDASAGKWVNLYESDFALDATPLNRSTTLTANIIRYVNKRYPVSPGDLPRAYTQRNLGDLWFEGNLLVRCNPTNMEITDVSAEIASIAALSHPAEVYEAYADRRSGMTLILSEAGLFEQTFKGFKRVELPNLKNQNVHVTILDDDQYASIDYGGTLIGVAPQDGGEIFVLEKDGRAHPTNGYCGLGPQDWFNVQFNYVFGVHPPFEHAIHRLSLMRSATAH